MEANFNLHRDAIQHIFSFLDEKSLGICNRVSREWNTQADAVWKKIYLGIENIAPENFKEYIKDHDLKPVKLDELDAVFQKFLTLSFDKNVSFHLICPFNKDCKINAHLTYQDDQEMHKAEYLLTEALPKIENLDQDSMHPIFVEEKNSYFDSFWAKNQDQCFSLFADYMCTVSKLDVGKK